MGRTPGPAEWSSRLELLRWDRVRGGRAVFPGPREPQCLESCWPGTRGHGALRTWLPRRAGGVCPAGAGLRGHGLGS